MTDELKHDCIEHKCPSVDQARWPEPRLHHRLIGMDELRAERIRMACAEGRPEVPSA